VHHPAVLAHAHPPGSVLKLATAYAFLSRESEPAEEGIDCRGKTKILGEELDCWDKRGHGRVDLTRALSVSCNLFFYRLGERLKPEELFAAWRAFGLGAGTGANLTREEAGALPEALSPAQRVRAGAGDLEAIRITPLQLLQIGAALAGRGQAKRLTLPGNAATDGLRLVNVPAVDRIREAMRQSAESGTLSATRLAALEGAGKTGTARWANGFHTHAWFVGFAPFTQPRFAAVVFADKGRGAIDAAQPGVDLLAAALGAWEPHPPRAEAPLEADWIRVRLLGKSHPRKVRVDADAHADRIACDGRPLEVRGASLEIDAGLLDLGDGLRCREVQIPECGFGVSVGGAVRHFRGRLRARVQDAEIALFDEVPLEDYLRGVVGSEIRGSPEALKAQAVVSRTWAIAARGRHREAGYDVCDLTHCQLYRGRDEEAADVDRAVQSTRGQVLRFGGELFATSFHSTCGGATSSPKDVFGEEAPLKGVSDVEGREALCAASPHSRWTWKTTRAQLARALGIPALGPAFEVLTRDRGGRALKIRTFGVPLTGEEFHSRVGRALGFQLIKSLIVEAEESGEEVRFKGRGLGHGVGMCQWGARELEKRGADYPKILEHYFPGGALVPPVR
jgi:stage II sporulation protein D